MTIKLISLTPYYRESFGEMKSEWGNELPEELKSEENFEGYMERMKSEGVRFLFDIDSEKFVGAVSMKPDSDTTRVRIMTMKTVRQSDVIDVVTVYCRKVGMERVTVIYDGYMDLTLTLGK